MAPGGEVRLSWVVRDGEACSVSRRAEGGEASEPVAVSCDAGSWSESLVVPASASFVNYQLNVLKQPFDAAAPWLTAAVQVAVDRGAVETVTVVAPVAPLPGASADALMVVTPFGEYSVGSDVVEGEFSVVEDSVSVVALMDTGRDFGWTAIWPAWFDVAVVSPAGAGGVRRLSAEDVVGAESTAVAAVFMQPGIFHTDVGAARGIMDELRVIPAVASFASLLELYVGDSDPFEVPAVVAAFEAAVEAAFEVLGVVDEVVGEASRSSEVEIERTSASVTRQLDVGVTDWSLDGLSLVPVWRSTYSRAGRGLSWAGRVYEVDAGRFDRSFDLAELWDEDPWRADIPLLPDPGVGGLYLAAD